MPAFHGKFQYLDEAGAAAEQGACELSFDQEICTIAPAGGVPLTFDLGDVDAIQHGDWEAALCLYTGKRIVLRQFGAAFAGMCDQLQAAWRERTLRCLLLEDLAEVARFNGTVDGSPAEIRIFGSNLAVLPSASKPAQLRLAEIDSIHFDAATYTFHLRSGDADLKVGKLAKRTEEFGTALGTAVDGLRRRAAEALHQTFPFLDADRLRRLVAVAPEGRSVKLTEWSGVHPDLPAALIERCVDPALKPYFDALRSKAREQSLMTGFKFIRGDEADEQSKPDEDTGTQPASGSPLFFWFFFPLAGSDVAAWEATTGSGRATYFFRAPPPVESSISMLTRGLALVNFRREPVYLADASLERDARYHRYAIGRRKLPDLAYLRGAFLGRAIHSSPAEWEQQVNQATGGPTAS